MKLYTYVTHGTGDGVQPFVVVRVGLEAIKSAAVAAVQYEPEIEGPCDACGERSARGEERPEDECECECHEDTGAGGWLEASCDESVTAIRAWDGGEDLTVFYWDGNEGSLTLTTTDLPEEE